MDEDGRKRAADSSYFFLPHIRHLLFPSLHPSGDAPSAGGAFPLHAGRTVPHGSVVRLTMHPAQLDSLRSLTISYGEFHLGCTLNWIDLHLFPGGVGFLTIQLEVPCPVADADAVTFLYHARLVRPLALGWEVPRWTPDGGAPFTGDDLLHALLDGLSEQSAKPLPPLADALAAPQERKAEPEFGSFRLYTYGVLEPEDPASPRGREDIDRVLYELATATHADDPDYEPDPHWLKTLLDRGRIAFWTNWRGMALRDNVVFLVTRRTRFTGGGFRGNVERDYFSLYLLTLYQKESLGRIAREFSRSGDDLYRNASLARSLRAQYVHFRANFWFAEVTSRPQGMELYHMFRRGLDLLPLYESIDSTVHELDEYYDHLIQARIGAALTLLTVVGLPAGILVTLYAPFLVTHGTRLQFAIVLATAYLLIALGWYIWRRRGRS